MSIKTQELKQAAKQKRFDDLCEVHADDKSGDEHRRAAAHAHVMTHHALEMDTPEAHAAAADAHRQVADMHEECADEYDSDEGAPSSEVKPRKKA